MQRRREMKMTNFNSVKHPIRGSSNHTNFFLEVKTNYRNELLLLNPADHAFDRQIVLMIEKKKIMLRWVNF